MPHAACPADVRTQPPLPGLDPVEGNDEAAAGPAVRIRTWTSPARAVVLGGIVGVEALPEEPHQEHDQGADVDHAEPDHEDPPLSGHRGAIVASEPGLASASMDDFERYVRSGLGLAEVDVSDVDLAIMRAAQAAYGPALEALDRADLADVWPEPNLDPGRPPPSP